MKDLGNFRTVVVGDVSNILVVLRGRCASVLEDNIRATVSVATLVVVS